MIFLEDGKEVFSYQGYIGQKDFYKLLGKFKLGDSEAFDVAFNKGTDARFCKEYQIFKNTPDCVFVDKLSGDTLLIQEIDSFPNLDCYLLRSQLKILCMNYLIIAME